MCPPLRGRRLRDGSAETGVHAFKARTGVILWSIAIALIAIDVWGLYELF
jgi:hypothetical protein